MRRPRRHADLCDATGMMEDDVVATLDQLGFILRRRPDIQLSIHMTVVVSVLLTWKSRQTVEVSVRYSVRSIQEVGLTQARRVLPHASRMLAQVDPSCLRWTPPVVPLI